METIISQQIKLGQRLACINNLISGQYQDIWDTCCDHGLLGYQLLQRNLANTVHFVDVVPELMQQLQAKLEQFAVQKNWQVHCIDLADLRLPSTGRQLIIIAGVGGDKTIELVSAILSCHPVHNIEFILCPVHHNYALRWQMIELGFALINEQLVYENKRYYEVLHIAKDGSLALTRTGSVMWDLSRKADQNYLSLTIAHYLRKARGGDKQAARIAAQYENLQSRHTAV